MVRPVLLSCVFLGTVSAQVWPPPPPWWSPRATTTYNNLYDQDDHNLDPSATWSHAVSLGSMYGDLWTSDQLALQVTGIKADYYINQVAE